VKETRETIESITEEFALMDDWKERFAYVIDLGRALPPLAPEYHADECKVDGCTSQVWLRARIEDGRVFFEADSDALIVKGLIALLLKVYSGRTPAEILDTPADFLCETGLLANLTPNRSNGLLSMMNRIREHALALQRGETEKGAGGGGAHGGGCAASGAVSSDTASQESDA